MKVSTSISSVFKLNMIWSSTIKDACKSIEGASRKNVPKFLVRKLLKLIKKNPTEYYEHIGRVFEASENEFKRILKICRDLNLEEKSTQSKKDYAKVINEIMEDIVFHSIFNEVLKKILNDFVIGKFGGIKNINREIYKRTIELLYLYSCNIIKMQASLVTLT